MNRGIALNPGYLCACESGKLFRECCLQGSGRILTAPNNIETPLPHTGLSNPSCYAAPLADCSLNMSREHYVSESFLKCIKREGPLMVGGMSWLPLGQKKDLPTRALTAKILCDRHNAALAPLDNVAKRLCQAMFRASDQDANAPVLADKESWEVFFNGYDIERWMLKVLCGVLISGGAVRNGVAIRDWTPPEQLLRILFKNEAFPAGQGLYLRTIPGAEHDSNVHLACEPFISPSSDGPLEMSGARVEIFGMPLYLILTDAHFELFGASRKLFTYRPREIRFTFRKSPTERSVKILRLSWPPKTRKRIVQYNWGPRKY